MSACSIIIPTRDRPDLLLRAVRSAFAALPEDGDVIVVDDASETPAADSLHPYAGPRLTVLRNDAPLGGGGSPSRNRGAQAAKGDVLFFLDDDDEMLPDYCASILSSDDAQQADFGFAARKFATLRSDGDTAFSREDRRLPAGMISPAQEFARRTFPFSAGFWITRSAYETAGPMATTLATNSDTEYCCRLYSKGLAGWYSPEPAVIVYDRYVSERKQLDNVTKRTKAGDRAAAFRHIAREYEDFLARDAGAAEFVHQRWMKHAHRAGQSADARSAAAETPQLGLRWKLRLQLASLRLIDRLRTRQTA